jgi:hypothetical protein
MVSTIGVYTQREQAGHAFGIGIPKGRTGERDLEAYNLRREYLWGQKVRITGRIRDNVIHVLNMVLVVAEAVRLQKCCIEIAQMLGSVFDDARSDYFRVVESLAR